jgi:hypothetical protein
MTTLHDQDDDLELTPEQQEEADANADAEMTAAFNAARGGDTHAEGTTKQDDAPAAPATPAAEGEPEDDPAGSEDAPPAAEPAPAEVNPDDEPVVITRGQLAKMTAAIDALPSLRDAAEKMNGRVGNLKQAIDAMKTQVAQGIRPSSLQMKRLKAEYGDLADILEQDMADVFGSTAAPAEAEPEQQDQPDAASGDTPGAAQDDPLAHPEVQAKLQAVEMRVVDAAHPGWREMKDTPEFATWYGALPATAQELLANTWDSSVMTDAFTDFKAWNAEQAAAKVAKEATNKQRKNRVENAIPATTGSPTGVTAVDDDAAFLAGFKSVRGK